MATSAAHQWLTLWTARAMIRDGFDVVAFDGPAEQAGWWNALPSCPFVGASRPDVVGVHQPDRFAIGEAKSSGDLASRRTSRQLLTFGWLVRRGAPHVEFYLTAPESAAAPLGDLLRRLLGAVNPRLHVTLVPDVLLLAELRS